jgi:hypothetical protein
MAYYIKIITLNGRVKERKRIRKRKGKKGKIQIQEAAKAGGWRSKRGKKKMIIQPVVSIG